MRPLTGCLRWLALALVTLAPGADAQIKVPKPPDTYDAQIRYRILADRNERVLQFEAMTKFFGGLGFKEAESEEADLAPFDPTAELMTGTIPSKNARRLLEDRRVQTIMLAPPGYKAPDDPQTPVRVMLELTKTPDQLRLFNQVEAALRPLGFKKDLGFDTSKFTLIRGNIPASNLPKLLRDLRQQPTGWLAPEQNAELFVTLPDGSLTPEMVKPFADVVPIRVVEVIGTVEAAPPVVTLPPIPAEQPQQGKWTADLRRRLAEEGARDKPIRLEVVLAYNPTDSDYEWRAMMTRAGATVEGRVGPVITVTVQQGAKAADLAALADVASVRLPRLSAATREEVPPPKKEEPKEDKNLVRAGGQEPTLPPAKAETDPLRATRLDRLHALDRKGQGIRVVIIDTDFAGWQKHLPVAKDAKSGRVEFIDVTAERNRDVRPDPMPGDFGHGTHCALAVRLAAPAADLTLVRVPPDAPYNLVNIARSVRGDTFRTEGIVSRRLEIDADFSSVRQRTDKAVAEYRAAFEDFSDEEPARRRRIAAQQALRKLGQEEAGVLARLERVEELEQSLIRLGGAHVILNLLYWNTGFAHDGASTTSRFLDDWLTRPHGGYERHLSRPNPTPKPLWFQPAGDAGGQAWVGSFRDADKNGVMEFAAASDPLKPDRWSHELNFLTTRKDGKDTNDLAGGSKIRVSVQWREPHDPHMSELDYRVPVAPLKLQLVKQRDPSGQKYASDEIDLVAESEGLPERLHVEPNFGVYEHSLEITLPSDGRYAVRLEGRVPNHLRPIGVPTLEAQEVKWELRPRVFVASADGKGEFALGDYTSPGGVAVPGDARSVFTIGAAGLDGKPRPYSQSGAGSQTELATKPGLLAPDTLPKLGDRPAATGTALSASFAAGWAAALRSAGLQPGNFPHALRIPPGGVIEVPEGWFRK
ncbi:MAG TPA: hypothetical protein VKE40_06875 [Gemmataceae bacterium]|nr:hypothetical protein [Gemmataceae bacterium]